MRTSLFQRLTPGKQFGGRKGAFREKFQQRSRKFSDDDGYETATTVASAADEEVGGGKYAFERKEVQDVVTEEQSDEGEEAEGPDVTVRRPKRKFNNPTERERFVRSY